MGIKLEHFDGRIPSEFICSHCHDVFLQPAVLSCMHMLCIKCYKKRMRRRSPVCPVCRKDLRLHHIEGKIDTEWKKRYDNLKINCPKGCETVLLLGGLDDHFTNHCPLSFTLCINIGCRKKVRRRDLSLHLERCDFRFVQCEGCGFRTKYINLRMHQIVQKCMIRNNLHMIMQNRREMETRVKEHRLKLQEESLKIELDERDLDRTRIWNAISRNEISRATTRSPAREKRSPELTDKDNASYSRVVHSAPVRSTTTMLCDNCNKLFSEHRNHGDACSWHKGVGRSLKTPKVLYTIWGKVIQGRLG